MVLSTIHSSSALNSISRLMELNTESFLLASTLKAVFYQRLVLKVCEFCNFKGCEKCNYTKYFGRTTIAESLQVDDDISTLLASPNAIENLKKHLMKINYQTIFFDSKQKVKKGITTLDEVYKVLGFEYEV